MSAHLRVTFSIGSSYDAECELVDWGAPWHGQRVRVYHGIDPATPSAAEPKAPS